MQMEAFQHAMLCAGYSNVQVTFERMLNPTAELFEETGDMLCDVTCRTESEIRGVRIPLAARYAQEPGSKEYLLALAATAFGITP